jgi:hypothetical protein
MSIMPLVNPQFFGFQPPREGAAMPLGIYYIDHNGVRPLEINQFAPIIEYSIND